MKIFFSILFFFIISTPLLSQTNNSSTKLEKLDKKYSNMMTTNFFPVKDGFVLINAENPWSIQQELVVFKDSQENSRIKFVLPSRHGGFISPSDTSSSIYYISQSTESRLANLNITKFDAAKGTSEIITLPGVGHLFNSKSDDDIYIMEYCFMESTNIYVEFSQRKVREDNSIVTEYYLIKFDNKLRPSGTKLKYAVEEKDWVSLKSSTPRIVHIDGEKVIISQLITDAEKVHCHVTSIDLESLDQQTIIDNVAFPELAPNQLTRSKRVDHIHGSNHDDLTINQNYLRFDNWSYQAGGSLGTMSTPASSGTRLYTLNSMYHCTMIDGYLLYYGLSKKKNEAEKIWSTIFSKNNQIETHTTTASLGKTISHIKGAYVSDSGINLIVSSSNKVYNNLIGNDAFTELNEASKLNLLNGIPSLGYSLESSLSIKSKFSEGVDKIRVVSSNGHTLIATGEKGAITIVKY
jgi:hypothetical protein